MTYSKNVICFTTRRSTSININDKLCLENELQK